MGSSFWYRTWPVQAMWIRRDWCFNVFFPVHNSRLCNSCCNNRACNSCSSSNNSSSSNRRKTTLHFRVGQIAYHTSSIHSRAVRLILVRIVWNYLKYLADLELLLLPHVWTLFCPGKILLASYDNEETEFQLSRPIDRCLSPNILWIQD